jgi:hypothetical protein
MIIFAGLILFVLFKFNRLKIDNLLFKRLSYLLVEIQTRFALSTEAHKLWEEENPFTRKILRNFELMLDNFKINLSETHKDQNDYFEKLVAKARSLIEEHQKAMVI